MGMFHFFRNAADINAGVAEYKATNGAVLLDVRTAEEYHNGHIDGSVNVPLDRISFIVNTVRDKNTPLYVHCLSGARSARAASTLKAMGYLDVTNIGGIGSYTGKVVKG